jgi:hypothetical protein
VAAVGGSSLPPLPAMADRRATTREQGWRRRGTRARRWWRVLRRALELTSADACPRQRGRGGCPCGGRISSTVAPSPASPATTSSPGREILPRTPHRRRGRGAGPHGGRISPTVTPSPASPAVTSSSGVTTPPASTMASAMAAPGASACSRFELPRHGAQRVAEVELDGRRRWSSASIPLLPWDDARAQRQVGRVCSEERESQECACPGSLPQNAAPDAVTTEGATVDSHSSFSRCGPGCSNRWSQSYCLALSPPPQPSMSSYQRPQE